MRARLSRVPLRLVAAGVLAIMLAGCAGAPAAHPSTTDESGNATGHNDTDVTFASMMIPHHRQAVWMAGLALSRTRQPEVRTVAEQILAEQNAEITQLQTFLTTWHAAIPDSST